MAIVGAFLFAAKGILAKLMYREGIDSTTLLALRMLLSAPMFAIMAAYTWRDGPRMQRSDWVKIAGLGFIGYYLSSYLSFLGLEYVSVGLERLILFLTPTVVLLLGMVLFKRSVSAMQWVSMGLAYAGIVLVYWSDTHGAGSGASSQRIALGAAIVFAASITYGFYLLMSGEVVKRYGSLRLVSLAMLVSTLYTMVHYVVLSPQHDLASLFVQTRAVWTLSLLNAVFCTVLPVSLLMLSVARLGAGTAAQAGMIGPVATIFLGYFVLAEPITALQMIGTALVLAGMVVLGKIKPI